MELGFDVGVDVDVGARLGLDVDGYLDLDELVVLV